MICLDTTFLVEHWRNRRKPQHRTNQFMRANDGEDWVVPLPVAGEFLEGAEYISPGRLRETLDYIRQYTIAVPSLDTAIHYAKIVSHLRREKLLGGGSKFDFWIAAVAVQHGAPLATRNVKHFEMVPGLRLAAY